MKVSLSKILVPVYLEKTNFLSKKLRKSLVSKATELVRCKKANFVSYRKAMRTVVKLIKVVESFYFVQRLKILVLSIFFR